MAISSSGGKRHISGMAANDIMAAAWRIWHLASKHGVIGGGSKWHIGIWLAAS